MKSLRNDIRAQVAFFLAPFFGLVGIGVALADIFLSGGVTGVPETGGLFGVQPINALGITIAIGAILFVVVIVILIVWAFIQSRREKE